MNSARLVQSLNFYFYRILTLTEVAIINPVSGYKIKPYIPSRSKMSSKNSISVTGYFARVVHVWMKLGQECG